MTFKHKLARRMAGARAVAMAVIAAAGCTDDVVPLTAAVPTPDIVVSEPAAAAAPVVLVGAGNVARCDRTMDEATASLLDNVAGTIFTTGDNVYASGSSSDYSNCYGPSWGRHKARTRPAPGELDYHTSGASGYYGYFGTQAGAAGKGYYSYDAGEWHVVVLNSDLDMSKGSAQEQWLRADLAARNTRCTLAYWHLPRFSSYSTNNRAEVKPLWDALYEAGVELVLNGHYRLYERFGPQMPDGVADQAFGIRQFTVGTGGISTNGFGAAVPNSEVRQTPVYGVLKLTLSTDAYQWQFIPIRGETFSDAGSGICHGKPGATVATVDVSPPTDSIRVGATVQLTATASDAAGFRLSNATMIWRSTDTLTAKVVAGLVTGVAVGSAYVIASNGGAADTAAITVLPIPVASVTLTPSTASVTEGEQVTLAATPRDSAGGTLANRPVTWSTSAGAVATVANGVVHGVSAGTATITATSEGQSATATITVASLRRAGWYVSPTGIGGDAGSYDRPWSLAYALSGAGGRVQPGDTIWMLGGTYYGQFSSTVRGAAGKPVVVRQYPGEHAVVDGPGGEGSIWRVSGDYTVFWGFEITKSDPARTTSSTGNHFRGNSVVNYASHTKYINLVVRDGGVAFYTDAAYTDIEIVGCLIYNNGWQGPDRGHGHALYLKSQNGPVVARDNVIFNQFGYGIHSYSDAGSGPLRNLRYEGNVLFNNGTLATNSSSANILLGGDDYATGDVLADNMTYFSPGITGKNVQIGYGTLLNGTVEFERNYLAGGSPVLQVGYWTTARLNGNTLIGSSSMVYLTDPSTAGQSWSSGLFNRDPLSKAWTFRSTSYAFTNWLLATGLSNVGTAVPGLPTATRVFVRPNPYERGRANVVVYNWSAQGSVLLDLSQVLAPGDQYEIRNVQDWHGTPVVRGTYAGGAVSLPIRAVSPPVPVGFTSSRAPSTGIAFHTYVVSLVK
jgi:hypothetical protein